MGRGEEGGGREGGGGREREFALGAVTPLTGADAGGSSLHAEISGSDLQFPFAKQPAMKAIMISKYRL